jgi:muramoyltetrapeptide carboxypeptidase
MNSSQLPIYCFAPSGKITDMESIKRAKSFLEDQGFELHNIECANRTYQRFAGSDQERLNEINDLPEITSSIGPNIALAMRGGFGISRLLPHIQWDRLAKAVDDGLVFGGEGLRRILQIPEILTDRERSDRLDHGIAGDQRRGSRRDPEP